MESKNDSGFGLVEIVVSMLMLAVLALALLPLLVQGLKQSAANATMATATQLVDGALDAAGRVASCSAVATGTTSTTDSRGNALSLVLTKGTCPTTYPGTATYSVVVTRVATGTTVASATTLLYLTGS